MSQQNILERAFQVVGFVTPRTNKSQWQLGYPKSGLRANLIMDTPQIMINTMRYATDAVVHAVGGDTNSLPSPSFEQSRIYAPTVSIRNMFSYNKDILRKWDNIGISYTEVAEKAAILGHKIVRETGGMVGFGQPYQGILNAYGKTNESAFLVADTNGVTQLPNQDQVQVRDRFISLVNDICVRNFIVNKPQEVVIEISQRINAVLSTRIIPMLAGGAGQGPSILQAIQDIMTARNITITWAVADRYLKDAGASGVGYDKIVLTLPQFDDEAGMEIDEQWTATMPVFTNNIPENNLMFMSSVIPTQYTTPTQNGGVATSLETGAITAGLNVRPSTVTVVLDVRMV